MHRHRDLLDLGAELLELRRRSLDGCIDGRLRVRVTESLLHDADLETVDALAKGLRVRSRAWRVLPRVEAVGPGDYFQEQGVVRHGGGHRTGVVESQLNRHDPGVRDKP